MKIIAIILSFYVLVLTAKPCIDDQKDMAKQKTEFSQTNPDTHHHNSKDICSPFCTCNCCATSVIFQEFRVQLNCFSFPEKQYSPICATVFSDPLASIWQPPKIA